MRSPVLGPVLGPEPDIRRRAYTAEEVAAHAARVGRHYARIAQSVPRALVEASPAAQATAGDADAARTAP